MGILSKVRGDAGQATVELVVVLPVAIALAVIVVNALSFFGDLCGLRSAGAPGHLRLCPGA